MAAAADARLDRPDHGAAGFGRDDWRCGDGLPLRPQDWLDLLTSDGVPVQAFTFDAVGNRTTVTTSAGIVAATYAADDRILSYNGQAITHDASGERATQAVRSPSPPS